MTPEQAVDLIIDEFLTATRENGPFNSAHEGFAVIEEERDELWDEIKKRLTSAAAIN